ncbi:MAG: transporter [Pedobacter sp.]
MKNLIILLFVILLTYSSANSYAANARGYIAQPEGTSIIFAYYKYNTGDSLYSNGDKVSNDLDFNSHVGIIRPIYYAKIGEALYGDGGFVIDPQVWLMFGDKDMDRPGVDLSSSGFMDPMVTATFWFVNAPKEKFWMGFTPMVYMPLGRYDKKKSFNVGENRWTFKPELGLVKGFGDNFYCDFVINTAFYTDNNDFFNGTGKVEKSQDPLLGMETHLSYNFTPKWFVSLDYFYSNGGETEVGGFKQEDEQDNHALGISSFWKIGKNQLLMVEYVNRFAVENGIGVDTFGLRWGCIF